jgi:hypothetical protein
MPMLRSYKKPLHFGGAWSVGAGAIGVGTAVIAAGAFKSEAKFRKRLIGVAEFVVDSFVLFVRYAV